MATWVLQGERPNKRLSHNQSSFSNTTTNKQTTSTQQIYFSGRSRVGVIAHTLWLVCWAMRYERQLLSSRSAADSGSCADGPESAGAAPCPAKRAQSSVHHGRKGAKLRQQPVTFACCARHTHQTSTLIQQDTHPRAITMTPTLHLSCAVHAMQRSLPSPF
jgi:hypothetical protein